MYGRASATTNINRIVGAGLIDGYSYIPQAVNCTLFFLSLMLIANSSLSSSLKKIYLYRKGGRERGSGVIINQV